MKLLDKLNAQMNLEYESAYIYRDMATYAASINFNGSKHWMEVQAAEEDTHAEKIRAYLLDKGYRPKFTGMKAANAKYGSLLDIFEGALAHEQMITASIKDIYKQAVEEADYEVQVFLNWFITEQVEEEANVGYWADLFKQIGDAPSGLFMLDAQLYKR